MYLLSVCLRVTGATFFCCTGQLVLNTEEGLEESAWGRVMAPKYTDIQYAVCVPLEQVMVGCTVRVRVYNSSVPERLDLSNSLNPLLNIDKKCGLERQETCRLNITKAAIVTCLLGCRISEI